MQGRCECCGNHYKKIFKIIMNDKEHFFDSFECAVTVLAPHCKHCGTMIIGHGVAAADYDDYICCCNHCLSAFQQDTTSKHFDAKKLMKTQGEENETQSL